MKLYRAWREELRREWSALHGCPWRKVRVRVRLVAVLRYTDGTLPSRDFRLWNTQVRLPGHPWQRTRSYGVTPEKALSYSSVFDMDETNGEVQ